MKTKMMPVVCCGCKRTIGYKPVSWTEKGIKPISHGICDECGPKLYPKDWVKKEKK